jgi:hypothetical protein
MDGWFVEATHNQTIWCHTFKRYLINYLHGPLSLWCSCSTKQLLVIWIGKLYSLLSTITHQRSPMIFWFFINRCWCDLLGASGCSLWLLHDNMSLWSMYMMLNFLLWIWVLCNMFWWYEWPKMKQSRRHSSLFDWLPWDRMNILLRVICHFYSTYFFPCAFRDTVFFDQDEPDLATD